LMLPMVFLARFQQGRQYDGRAEPFLAGGRGVSVPLPFVLFAALATVRLIFSPSAPGLQNVAVLVGFGFVCSVVAALSSAGTADRVLTGMRVAAIIASLLFIGTQALGAPIYGGRSFALTALISLAVLVPHRPENVILRAAPFLVVLAVVLSLSRTASAIALLLLIFMVTRGRKSTRAAGATVILAVAAAAAYWAVTSYAPIRDRFLGGDNAVNYGGVSLNTSGRSQLWEIILNSSAREPFFGHGPGSAELLISSLYPNIAHPHNDYLRLLHDFGWVGLILFALGYAVLFARVFKRARRLDSPVHWSAVATLTAIAIAALTDNVIVYPFVMVPAAVVVGLSMAAPLEQKLPIPADAAQPKEQQGMQQAIPSTTARIRNTRANWS
jgi:O-antigen ligase